LAAGFLFSGAETGGITMEQDKITGCLLGIGIGDGLGAPFELRKPGPKDPRLRESNGEIRDFHPFLSYPPGSFSDDTGMTLATIRGLINHARSRKSLESCLRKAFREWAGSDECRQPGHTVYHSAKYGKTDENAWSSGALMRTAPVAVYAYLKNYSDKETAELAFRVARLTHGHQLAVFPAVECTLALRSILSGKRKVPRNLTDHDLLAGAAGKYGLGDYLEYRSLKTAELPATTGLYLWKQVFEDLLGMREGASWASLPRFEEGDTASGQPKRGS
jgi:ADP-ribosylglycohydrolase